MVLLSLFVFVSDSNFRNEWFRIENYATANCEWCEEENEKTKKNWKKKRIWAKSEQLLPFQTIVSCFFLLHFHIQNNNNYSYWSSSNDEIGGWQMAKDQNFVSVECDPKPGTFTSQASDKCSVNFSSSSFTFFSLFHFRIGFTLDAQIVVIQACNWNQSWHKKKADIISDVHLLPSSHLIFAHFFPLHSPSANLFTFQIQTEVDDIHSN